MLTDDQIYDAASRVTNSESDYEASIELSHALRMIYTCAVEDAIQRIKDELRDSESLVTETEVIVKDSPKLIGREPWYMRKTSLEKKFRKDQEQFEKDIRDSAQAEQVENESS